MLMRRVFQDIRTFAKPSWNTMEFENYNFSLPDKDALAPRDGCKQNLSNSEDLLFLAGLMSGNYGDMIFHFEKDGKPVFLREKDGKYYHPFLDLEINVDESYIPKSKISRSTVRKKFRARFLHIRKKIHFVVEQFHKTGEVTTDEDSENIFLGTKIIHGRDATAEDILYIEKKMDPSMEIGNDPFIHRLHEQPLFNFEIKSELPPKTLICPCHGPVKPRYGFSMDSTKRPRYKEGYALCPKCYGTLAKKMLVRGF